MFSKDELKEIEERGSSKEKVLQELNQFKAGFEMPYIVAAATPNRGVKVFSKEEQHLYVNRYSQFQGQVCKFVPASGAATRMFKDLYDGINSADNNGLKENSLAKQFVKEVSKYPFYNDLKEHIDLLNASDKEVLEALLLDKGMGYGKLPKGLIKFHKYDNGQRTAFEEQLAEASKYAVDSKGVAKLVISVSKEHLPLFNEILKKNLLSYQEQYGCTFDISFTIQKPSTDTIAVDLNNNPIKDKDGKLVFRPAGHGALIENLNDIDYDVVIIKNIDNVAREELTVDTVWWKKVLAGYLLETQDKLFSYLRALDGEKNDALLVEIRQFLKSQFCIDLPKVPIEIEKEFLKSRLNRPLRVCGMVKNLGEPGGGPFLVKDADGSVSLQILESAQIDMKSSKVKDIVTQATHFNPVDLVCSLKNYRGKKFDLPKYVDPETGFISVKSLEGISVKALELPGLWNGAMSRWNTIFVEVPISTFTPVKTVFDLLRPEHIG